MAELRLRAEGLRPAFAPRARWVLETLAEALGREPAWSDGQADLVYAPERPADGVWIPADDDAQAFFEAPAPFPGDAVHREAGLTLLFPPSHPGEPVPGDLVASAFYLLARWDELRVADRDRFGRLPLAASAFGRVAGLDLADPPGRGLPRRPARGAAHPAADALGRRPDPRHRPPAPADAQGAGRHRPPPRAARAGRRAGAGPTRGTTCPTCSGPPGGAGLRSTVFLIGRNAPPPGRHAAARLRARAPGAGRRRAGRGRRGGPARLVRRGRRPRRAGRRAGLAARRGRAGRWGALPLPALPLPRDRARAGARRGGVRLQPGLQRGARLRRRHRPALPAVPGGRGAPGRASPCCRWR